MKISVPANTLKRRRQKERVILEQLTKFIEHTADPTPADVYAQSVLKYETSPLDEFANFRLTQHNQTSGKNTDADLDRALTLNNRSYITFNFKGKGNAFLTFHEVARIEAGHSFTVEIGGGINYSRVAVYNLLPDGEDLQLLAQKRIVGITSESKYRSFWIFWNIFNATVHVGLCNTPGRQEVLQSHAFVDDNITHISISTNSDNSGLWEFGSDESLYGACDHEGGCNSNESLTCDVGDPASPTRHTCMPVGNDTVFGSAKCQFHQTKKATQLFTTMMTGSITTVRCTGAICLIEPEDKAISYTSRLLSTALNLNHSSSTYSSMIVPSRSTSTMQATQNVCPDVGKVAVITATGSIVVFMTAGFFICLCYSRYNSHIISPVASRDSTNGENEENGEDTHDARQPHSV